MACPDEEAPKKKHQKLEECADEEDAVTLRPCEGIQSPKCPECGFYAYCRVCIARTSVFRGALRAQEIAIRIRECQSALQVGEFNEADRQSKMERLKDFQDLLEVREAELEISQSRLEEVLLEKQSMKTLQAEVVVSDVTHPLGSFLPHQCSTSPAQETLDLTDSVNASNRCGGGRADPTSAEKPVSPIHRRRCGRRRQRECKRRLKSTGQWIPPESIASSSVVGVPPIIGQ